MPWSRLPKVPLAPASSAPTLLAAAAMVAAVGLIDYATGTELRVYPLYFIPVAEASWRLGRRAGIGIALASGLTWLVANLLAGIDFSSPLVMAANTAVQCAAFAVLALLIAAYRQALSAERRFAREDELTGLANARAFYERAELEAARAARSATPLAVAYLDLDRFKEVNDRLGHHGGDEVLAAVGGILRQRLRRTDFAARLGGDEFGILLPSTDAAGTRLVLDALRDAIPAALRERGIELTASVGAIVFTTAPQSVDAMLAAADAHMYEAKRAGRDRVVVTDLNGATGPAASHRGLGEDRTVSRSTPHDVGTRPSPAAP